jgi:hypothetical protein
VSETVQGSTISSGEQIEQDMLVSYRACLPDMMAIPVERLKILRYDIPTAATAVIGSISKLSELADDIQATFKNVDPQLIPNLRQQAKAMARAYVLNQAASKPSLSVTELSARIVAIRADLESDARNAARRGLIDPERLKELQGAVGYKNQAFDTLLLAALLRAAWPKLEGKTFVTAAEVDEANVLAYQLLQAVGEKEQLTPASQETADILFRAIALFEDTYYEVDRLVQCVRYYQKDAGEWLPTLYPRSKRKNGDADKGETPTREEGDNAAPFSRESGVVAAITAPASNIAQGMPGADPFIRTGTGDKK